MISELMQCSLADILEKPNNRRLLPKKKQILYAKQLACGMNYLHTCKPNIIIHRDLKPENLLIDFSDNLKISDFGLAKILPLSPYDHHNNSSNTDGNNKLTGSFKMTGETGKYTFLLMTRRIIETMLKAIGKLCIFSYIKGSYRYMAPEVFRHQSYNETVDIYSYGMIFYYMLSGTRPWPTLHGVDACKRAALEGKRPCVPTSWNPMLCAIIQGCWDGNSRVRPSFKEILDALEEHTTSKKSSITCGFVESMKQNMVGM